MRVLKFCDNRLTSEAGGFCDKYSLGIDRFRFHDTIRVLARKTVLGWLGQLVDQLFRLKTNQVEFTTVYIREREVGIALQDTMLSWLNSLTQRSLEMTTPGVNRKGSIKWNEVGVPVADFNLHRLWLKRLNPIAHDLVLSTESIT